MSTTTLTKMRYRAGDQILSIVVMPLNTVSMFRFSYYFVQFDGILVGGSSPLSVWTRATDATDLGKQSTQIGRIKEKNKGGEEDEKKEATAVLLTRSHIYIHRCKVGAEQTNTLTS